MFSIFSSGSYFVQLSRIILAILVKGHIRNTPVKLFSSGHWPRRRCHLKDFLFLANGGHFV